MLMGGVRGSGVGWQPWPRLAAIVISEVEGEPGIKACLSVARPTMVSSVDVASFLEALSRLLSPFRMLLVKTMTHLGQASAVSDVVPFPKAPFWSSQIVGSNFDEVVLCIIIYCLGCVWGVVSTCML